MGAVAATPDEAPRILWISTKAPWPPRDGGRLLQWLTLEALAAEGAEITLVAPVDPAAEDPGEIAEALGRRVSPVLVLSPRRRRLAILSRLLSTRLPWTAAAHDHPGIRRRVAALLAEGRFDVVHAEQVQAWPQTSPARAQGLPVVLRAQNVESDLWRQTAELTGLSGPLRWALRWEAARLARWEAKVVRRASAVTALTRGDCERLSELAGGREVIPVAAPFPQCLPAGEGTLEGNPPLVLFGSGGWMPNLDAGRWFLAEIWPQVLSAEPTARLHVFGDAPGTGDGVLHHPAPRDSREAFVPGSLLVVPIRIASGVRMKILEAWARGIPVLATPEAAAGLDAAGDRELWLFHQARQLVDIVRTVREDPQKTQRVGEAARSRLRDHEQQRVARELVLLYRRLIG